jgi:hypothetical protein
MALLISVAPVGDEWAIRSDALDEDLFFQSGGRAESAARDLASRRAAEGQAAEVRIFIRGGALAGVLSFPALAPAPVD